MGVVFSSSGFFEPLGGKELQPQTPAAPIEPHSGDTEIRFEKFPLFVKKAFDDFISCSKYSRLVKISTQRPDEYMVCRTQVIVDSGRVKGLPECFRSGRIWISGLLPSTTHKGAKHYFVGLECSDGSLLAIHVEEEGGTATPSLVDEVMR
jgi:hypothetical protein